MGPCIRATVIYFSLQFYLPGYIHIFTYLKVPTLKYILVYSFQNMTFSLIMIQIAAYMWPYCIIQDSHITCFNDCIAE